MAIFVNEHNGGCAWGETKQKLSSYSGKLSTRTDELKVYIEKDNLILKSYAAPFLNGLKSHPSVVLVKHNRPGSRIVLLNEGLELC